VIVQFGVLGVVVAGVLLAAMVRGPVTARLGSHFIAYSTDLRAGGLVVVLYVVATCGSLMFSGVREIARFCVLNFAMAGLLAWLTFDGFARCGAPGRRSAAQCLQWRQATHVRSVSSTSMVTRSVSSKT
jgi:hypothetical protein